MLKKSKGLTSKFIEFSKFGGTRFNDANKSLFLPIFEKLMKSITKTKKDFRIEKKNFATENITATSQFWERVIEKASQLNIGLIGFTTVDENFIFKKDIICGIDTLYETGIILGMEMDFNAINKAPEIEAGVESMRIYAELGESTNLLADFIKSEGFRAIACHPLGGPILYPPMAVKAGIGEIGRNGLLITKKYGPRLRLSMISTNALNFPKSTSSDLKLAEFCNKCGICIRKCPTNAILETPLKKDFTTISRIDSSKCFEYFYKTYGCSICIKVCPFNLSNYEKIIS
ncbi:MAG: 4Fe-4S dicluster domain-containing protein [Candidatus Helarchaeota archaeon]